MQNFFKNVSWLYRLHRWVSFLCAAFFLLLCITGLPLLFKDEISSLNSVENVPMQPMGYDALWDTVSKGQEQLSREYPGKIVKAISADAEKGQLLFRVENPGEMAGHARMKMGGEQLAFSPDSDSLFQHSQAVVRYPAIKDFMHFMHVLHLRLGFGQGGMVFLGIFCALSAFSVLTGLFLYWPMMKKISFGTVRDFSRSVFLADTHKFIGMIAGVWAFLLCVSGTMIVVFSLGYGAYLHGIDVKGSQQFAKVPMTQQRSLSEAMSWLEEQYPDRNLLVAVQNRLQTLSLVDRTWTVVRQWVEPAGMLDGPFTPEHRTDDGDVLAEFLHRARPRLTVPTLHDLGARYAQAEDHPTATGQ